ncbi:hypothetical protein LX16_0205 [Stackebrandtia albiflava]|uniref:DUF3817 domain-containing protein n=1 Tax=Stackebrandtia albiflava TaxID=406432 RepID=A0A562V9H3_9ACTN|nr:hypothetical protein [Stackebrandtia albiflava]TWJ14520.1 hypothetical protein LX16_0205 [Stackebrandtia albiflava]
MTMRILRIAALVEAVSLVVLLVNLATVHAPGISGWTGPLHGASYVTVIVTGSLARSAVGVPWRVLIPGVGGLLMVRRIDADRRDGDR